MRLIFAAVIMCIPAFDWGVDDAVTSEVQENNSKVFLMVQITLLYSQLIVDGLMRTPRGSTLTTHDDSIAVHGSEDTVEGEASAEGRDDGRGVKMVKISKAEAQE